MKIYIYLICFLLSLNILGQDLESDSLALVEIYNQLDGPNWVNSDHWLTDTPVAEWEGIKVENGRVTEFNKSNAGLKGSFPDAIYLLDGLKKLKIFNAEIEGTISDKLYGLQELEEITLSNLGLSGDIPQRLDTLAQLERLDLSRNEFMGTLPNLPPDLIRLHVYQNSLTGPIPESYAALPMWQIDVSNNALTGSLDIIENWKDLDGFKGSFNDWDEQPLPSWLDEMPEMRSFTCSWCNLSGDLPAYNWNGAPDFYQLIANNNELSGDISNLPLEMSGGNFPWIDLANNAFSGELPTHEIKMVNKLYLNNNDFDNITTFEYEHLINFRLAGNKLSLSALIDDFPQIIQDSLVSQYTIGNQRSPFEDQEITITEGETLTLEADDVVEAAAYQWYSYSSAIEGATSSTLNIEDIQESDEGDYSYKVTHPSIYDSDGELVEFTSKTFSVEVEMNTSTLEINSKYKIFPNPVSDFIHIENPPFRARYSISNIQGVLILQGEIGHTSRIPVQDLIPGNYILQITTEGKTDALKFLKF